MGPGRSKQQRWQELSDLIIDFDDTGVRVPVGVADVEARLTGPWSRSSRRILRSLPAVDGVLDGDAVDAVLLRSHLELQRLAEEIQHGERVARILIPFLDRIPGPKRVVDIGCGLGYLVRYFTHTGCLGPEVTVVGSDINRSLLAAARHLAELEELDCTFIAGNAFSAGADTVDTTTDGGAATGCATVFVSSGVLHHFEDAELATFFARQAGTGALGCFHFDVAPSRLTPLGAWVFHQARMREPLARHDGLRSALRAHHDHVLVDALATGAPDWMPLLFDPAGDRMAVLNVMRPIIGMHPDLEPGYRDALGSLAHRLHRGRP